MYASEREVYGLFLLTDQREVSQLAAERFAQLKAAASHKRERRALAKRAARGRRSQAAVATTT